MEKIICAAVRIDDINKVFYGHRHTHAIAAMHDGLSWEHSRKEITGMKTTQGFVSSTGRFVERNEAFKIAVDNDQILDMNDTRGNELYSEDLY